MSYAVDFNTVSTVGLESSPVAGALAGLRAHEARHFKNKYDHVFTVEPAGNAKTPAFPGSRTYPAATLTLTHEDRALTMLAAILFCGPPADVSSQAVTHWRAPAARAPSGRPGLTNRAVQPARPDDGNQPRVARP
jgi:hypothetical protein